MLPKSPPVSLAVRLCALWLTGHLAGHSVALGQEETLVEIKASAGLRFDPPRFQVKPKAKVRLQLHNADDMAHNLVVVKPEGRMPVVNAAMVMPITPEQTFVPALPEVLWSIPILTPNKTGTLEFTAPEKEGVYPFVCTYPGHGMVMYGAMYVGTQKLPTVDKDENLPEMVRELADPKKKPLHAYPMDPPYFYRMFVRDSGPASVAVALPGGNNYVWDATACRLRYAWRGAFLDPMPHWSGNGDGYAEVLGRIFWRSAPAFPLRFGSANTVPKSIKFRGYRLVERYPEFRYEVDGVEVRELIKAPHHGTGLTQTFTMGTAPGPVFYVSNPGNGATFETNAGAFKDGVLQLTADEARNFTISINEVAGQQPLGYWSMDDILTEKKPLPVDGVKGRALVFDGKKARFATKINTNALSAGATFALWVKLTKPEAADQVVLGAKGDAGEFAIGSGVAGAGFGVTCGSQKLVADKTTDDDWHYLTVTLTAEALTLYLDGQKVGTTLGAALPADTELYLGSQGNTRFAAATLDEVRIYDRVLTEKEIKTLYTADRSATPAP